MRGRKDALPVRRSGSAIRTSCWHRAAHQCDVLCDCPSR